MITESEAKKKWCPMVRLDAESEVGSGTTNRVQDNNPKWTLYSETRCYASECMMWVWERGIRINDASKGFCGLSRKD